MTSAAGVYRRVVLTAPPVLGTGAESAVIALLPAVAALDRELRDAQRKRRLVLEPDLRSFLTSVRALGTVLSDPDTRSELDDLLFYWAPIAYPDQPLVDYALEAYADDPVVPPPEGWVGIVDDEGSPVQV